MSHLINRAAVVCLLAFPIGAYLSSDAVDADSGADPDVPREGRLTAPSTVVQEGEIELVSGTWRYEFDADSSLPHRVYVTAEILNPGSTYLSSIVVRSTA